MSLSVSLNAISGDPAFARLADELLAHLADGDPSDVDGLLAAHPEHAERLRKLLPSLTALAAWRRVEALPGDMEPRELTPLRTLGDFQIFHELGRGGMGIVYEAIQISLGRRVALKVLPFAAVLDPRQLQRFKHEASAAAILRHPHIVGIHCVGEDRGVYYYAMELIEGHTLAEVIQERSQEPGVRSQEGGSEQPEARSFSIQPIAFSARNNSQLKTEHFKLKTKNPSLPPDTLHASLAATARDAGFFFSVARLGIQAAEALDHAHAHGIVHRDIKPSNLMVDARAHLWVTDFGLAHIETGPNLTMTGDMLGTLRYMSPEQASGRPTMVDHRSDIYSLGATLYELATDRPVVQGQARAAILREIAETDPAPPRTYTPAMPADLETILLKCLAKEPTARYDTAQALADDLRRFLESKPVLAKRPRWFDMLLKSARRHKAVWIATLASAFVLLVGALAAVVWKESATSAALAAEQRERARAEQNLHEAHEAVETLLARVAASRLLKAPHAEPLRKQLLADALAANKKLLALNAESAEARLETTRAQVRLGYIHALMGERAAARSAYQQGIASAEQLLAEMPEDHRCQDILAKALDGAASSEFSSGQREDNILAQALDGAASSVFNSGQGEVTEALMLRALEIRRSLFTAHPEIDEYRRELAEVAHDFAAIRLTQGRLPEAVDGFRESLAIVPEAADNRVNLGLALRGLGDLSAAESELRQAVEFENPEDPHTNPWARWTLGGILFESGQFEEAKRQTRQATDRFEQIVAEHPDVPEYGDSLAFALLSLGSFLQQDQPDESFKARRRAVEVLEAIVARWAEVPRYKSSLATAYEELRISLTRLDDAAELVAHLGKELALLERLATETPKSEDYRLRVGRSAHRLADHLGNADSIERERLYRRSAGALSSLSESQRELPRNKSALSSAQCNVGKLLADREQYQEARTWLESAVALQEAVHSSQPRDVATRTLLKSEYERLADILAALGKDEQAASYREKARTLDAAETSDK